MAYNEADTRAKLIDPAIHRRGWTEDFIRREETAGTIEIIAGKGRRRGRGKVDITLRIKVNPDTQPVAVALIEAKKESLPPDTAWNRPKGTPPAIVSMSPSSFPRTATSSSSSTASPA